MLPFFFESSTRLVVDYSEVYQLIKKVMTTPHDTLEELVSLITSQIRHRYTFAQKIDVTVRKLSPPFSCDLGYVEVSDSVRY